MAEEGEESDSQMGREREREMKVEVEKKEKRFLLFRCPAHTVTDEATSECMMKTTHLLFSDPRTTTTAQDLDL